MNTPLFLYKQNDFEKLKTSLKSCFIISLKMTSSSKQIRQKTQSTEKKVFLNEYVENADLYKSIMN